MSLRSRSWNSITDGRRALMIALREPSDMASAIRVGLTPSQNLVPIAGPSVRAARLLGGARMLRQEAPNCPTAQNRAHHER